MDKNLKSFPDLENALIECGMILGTVGFNKDEDKNYVLIKFNNSIKTADLRLQQKADGTMEFCIYPLDRDYQNEMATFSCIGDFNRDKGVSLRQIEFSEMGYATAGIVEDYERGGHMVLGTTTDLIVRRSEKEQEKLMAEASEAFKSKETATIFLKKNAHKITDRLLVEQYFRFDEDPMTYVKSFQDAYDVVEELLQSNVGFRRERFEQFPDNALLQVASDGVDLMEVLASESVEAEIHVVVINGLDYSRGITPYYAKCFVGQAMDKNSEPIVYSMVTDREITIPGKQLYYRGNPDGTVSVFRTSPDGSAILEQIELEGAQYKWCVETKYLNQEISKKVSKELLGIESEDDFDGGLEDDFDDELGNMDKYK